MLSQSKLNDVLPLLPIKLKNLIFSLSDDVKKSIREIRLRNGKPIVVVTNGGSSFLTVNSKLTYILSDALPTVTKEELNEVVKRACNYSVYSYQQDINNGFITVSGANRIGICGRAVTEQGKTVSVSDISSVNIRVSGEFFGCADGIVKKLFYNSLCNLIIAGPPMCGKTTVIRDLARQLSDGNNGKYCKCTIIDERNEIACITEGRCGCDIGANSDVLSGYKKDEAIKIAVSSLSPDIIFCDEVTDINQCRAITDGIMSGCCFAVSAHCDSLNSLLNRSVTKALTDSGLFDYAVFLGTNDRLGEISAIYDLKERKNEIYGNCRSDNGIGYDSQLPGRAD